VASTAAIAQQFCGIMVSTATSWLTQQRGHALSQHDDMLGHVSNSFTAPALQQQGQHDSYTCGQHCNNINTVAWPTPT
jgi:hypothetical protein